MKKAEFSALWYRLVMESYDVMGFTDKKCDIFSRLPGGAGISR
jgi:hypothetical protein